MHALHTAVQNSLRHGVCARYSAWGVRSPLSAAPAKARRREGRANRGGTANFRPLPNSHLAGAFIFALAATNGGKTHDDL